MGQDRHWRRFGEGRRRTSMEKGRRISPTPEDLQSNRRYSTEIDKASRPFGVSTTRIVTG
jgi:hypothetical protein